MKYTPGWDLSSIPDELLLSECAKRHSARRQTHGAGPGRPKKLTSCPYCGKEFGTAELRKHRPVCPKRK
jgi:hypothetical protein